MMFLFALSGLLCRMQTHNRCSVRQESQVVKKQFESAKIAVVVKALFVGVSRKPKTPKHLGSSKVHHCQLLYNLFHGSG